MSTKILIEIVFLSFLVGFSSCSRKNSRLARNYYALGVLELDTDAPAKDRAKKAAHFFDRAFMFDDNAYYAALAATLYFKQGDLDRSLQRFHTSLESQPNEIMRLEILNNYACLLARLGRGGQACDIWSKLAASARYSTPQAALVNHSRYLMSQHKFSDAKVLLLRALDCDPHFTDAHRELLFLAKKYPHDPVLVSRLKKHHQQGSFAKR